jgi:hypothetical protein
MISFIEVYLSYSSCHHSRSSLIKNFPNKVKLIKCISKLLSFHMIVQKQCWFLLKKNRIDFDSIVEIWFFKSVTHWYLKFSILLLEFNINLTSRYDLLKKKHWSYNFTHRCRCFSWFYLHIHLNRRSTSFFYNQEK